MKKAVLHQPAFEPGLRDLPRASRRGQRTTAARRQSTRFVWSATGPNAKPQKLEGEHLITIFNGKVKLPEDYFKKVILLPLQVRARTSGRAASGNRHRRPLEHESCAETD